MKQTSRKPSSPLCHSIIIPVLLLLLQAFPVVVQSFSPIITTTSWTSSGTTTTTTATTATATVLNMSASQQQPSQQHPVAQKLKQLGITLPPPTTPKGNYCLAVRTGNLLHLSGHIPLVQPEEDGKTLLTGTLGDDLTVEEGYAAAKACAIQLLATLSDQVEGDWSRVVRIVKLVGFVQCTPEFDQQPAVMNGASDLLVQVFGKDVGMHARSAVGTNALPLNIATEVECIVEIKD